jgi:hypothetical protein
VVLLPCLLRNNTAVISVQFMCLLFHHILTLNSMLIHLKISPYKYHFFFLSSTISSILQASFSTFCDFCKFLTSFCIETMHSSNHQLFQIRKSPLTIPRRFLWFAREKVPRNLSLQLRHNTLMLSLLFVWTSFFGNDLTLLQPTRRCSNITMTFLLQYSSIFPLNLSG